MADFVKNHGIKIPWFPILVPVITTQTNYFDFGMSTTKHKNQCLV